MHREGPSYNAGGRCIAEKPPVGLGWDKSEIKPARVQRDVLIQQMGVQIQTVTREKVDATERLNRAQRMARREMNRKQADHKA